LTVSLGITKAAYNNARGEYAVGIRLSISPTTYAEAAVYFKIFDSLSPSPPAKVSTCTFS